VNITACTFLDCSSSGDGGAIYFYGFRLAVVWSSTFSCTAGTYGASLEAYPAGYLSCAVAFSDGASIGGSSQFAALDFFPSLTAGSESVLERANVTGNSVTQAGAAAYFDECDGLRFQFCEIRSNTGSNCLLIRRLTTALIRCISVRSNTANGSSSRLGLFYVETALTISESAIAENDAPFLVHGSGSYLLTFFDCHFDNSLLNASIAVFSTENCSTDAAAFPGPPATCLSRTCSPLLSLTPPLSASPSAPFVASALYPPTAVLVFSSQLLPLPEADSEKRFLIELIAGTGAGALVIAILLVLVVCIRRRLAHVPKPSTTDQPSLPPEEDPETLIDVSETLHSSLLGDIDSPATGSTVPMSPGNEALWELSDD
jgi:hypothetical protein